MRSKARAVPKGAERDARQMERETTENLCEFCCLSFFPSLFGSQPKKQEKQKKKESPSLGHISFVHVLA